MRHAWTSYPKLEIVVTYDMIYFPEFYQSVSVHFIDVFVTTAKMLR